MGVFPGVALASERAHYHVVITNRFENMAAPVTARDTLRCQITSLTGSYLTSIGDATSTDLAAIQGFCCRP